MAKIKRGAFGERVVTAHLAFSENGERREDDFKIIYKAMSPKRTRELNAIRLTEEQRQPFAEALANFMHEKPESTVEELKAQISLLLLLQEEETSPFVENLAEVIVAMPDVEEDDGSPAAVSAEMLDSTFDWENLRAINAAIQDDINPPKPSSNA